MAEQEGSSHKRTFSTGPDQNSVDDPSAKDVPAVLPPTKKTKLECDESAKDTETTTTSTSTLDDGDDLIPLTSQGPNVFYGYTDALSDLLEYGEDPGPYWLKTMVMDRYNASRAGDQVDQDSDDAVELTYAGITSDEENLQTPEAKLLLKHFEGLSGDLWYEVTVKREKPGGMRLQVTLESSRFDQGGYVHGGKGLGEWWISNIRAAEGESHKAMVTVRDMMF